MSDSSNKVHLVHLDLFRLFCVFTIVTFHCLRFLMYGPFPSMREISQQFDNSVHCGPIVVAMPLFTFISGYLYAYLKHLGKYSKDIPLIKNKTKRLLLPYIFFVILFCITTEFQHTDFITITKHIEHHLIFGDYNHLWYLPMLFWCFVIIQLFEHISTSKVSLLLLLTLAFFSACIIPVSAYIFNLKNVAVWFYWFLLGVCYFRLRDYLILVIGNIKKKALAFICVCVCEITLTHFFGFPNYKRQFNGAEIIIITIFIIVLFIIIEELIKYKKVKKIFTSSIVKSVSKYSFGIYIFHYWLAPLIISSTAKRIFHLEQFAEHYYIFPIVFSIVTFVASYAVTYLFQKTKLGKYLLG